MRNYIEHAHSALIYHIATLDLDRDLVCGVRRVKIERPILFEECDPVRQLVVVWVRLLASSHKIAIAIHEVCSAYVTDGRELLRGGLLLENVNLQVGSRVVCFVFHSNHDHLASFKSAKLRKLVAIPKETISGIWAIEH